MTKPTTTEFETIQHSPLDMNMNMNETIIPRLWSDDLHGKWFAPNSTTNPSNLARNISILSPPAMDMTATIRNRPIVRPESMTTNSSTSTSTSATNSLSSSSISSTHLGSKLAGDVLVAVTVTFGVAPFLTVVDKAIVESASGTNSIVRSAIDSLRGMARNPVDYFRSPTFLLMWGVYGATYSTANSFKTLEEHATYRRDRDQNQNQSRTNNPSGTTGKAAGTFAIASFLGTTLVNSGASMLKDRAYARMFSGSSSASAAAKPFPKASYAFWAMRDLSVIGSSFLLPELVASKLVENSEMDREKALSICQIGLPVLAQFVAGPFQYLGLDVYNRNLSHLSTPAAIADRTRQLAGGIAPVIAARIARIVPGYSIGGVANTKLRTAWRKKLLERDVAAMMKNGGESGRSGNNEYATRMVALLHGSQRGDGKKSS